MAPTFTGNYGLDPCAAIALAVDFIRLPIYISSGLFDIRFLAYLPGLLVVALAGSWIGKKLVDRLPQRIFRIVVLVILLLIGLKFITDGFRSSPTVIYTSTVSRSNPITLTGDQVMEIVDTDFTQGAQITLRENAKLIIKNSRFNHTNQYPFQHTLNAWDNAQVIVEDSTLLSSPWLNWNFFNSSQLTLRNVNNSQSRIWHGFQNSAKATVRNARFSGTISQQAAFDIEDSPATYLEYVFPDGVVVDETLPVDLPNYQFPNANDTGITFSVATKNSKANFWGITVNPNDDVTIRNVTRGLTVTFSIKFPLQNVTAEFDNLKATTYVDQTWNVAGMKLRLLNTKTTAWSPIVGDGNTLVIRNSELADNAFSWGASKIIIEDSSMSFVRAKDQVEITLRNSSVSGDVVAIDHGIVHLINTSVGGKKVTEGSGQILSQ